MLPVNPATAYALLHDYVAVKPGDWIELGLASRGLGGAKLRVLFEGGVQDLAKLVRAVEDGGTVVTYTAVTGQPPAHAGQQGRSGKILFVPGPSA
jgi:hypothetical protein